MATLKIFTVFDARVQAYLPPFYDRSVGSAIRSFEQAANDVKHTFGMYPADFTLFELGEFEDSSALFKFHPTAMPLGKALDFVKPIVAVPPDEELKAKFDQLVKSVNQTQESVLRSVREMSTARASVQHVLESITKNPSVIPKTIFRRVFDRLLKS